MLDDVQAHIDAVARGESVEERIALIRASNSLDEDAKRRQVHFLKSFCLAAALEPLCGQEVKLGEGLSLFLHRSRLEIEGKETPGVRVDGFGDLVIEGDFLREGQLCARDSGKCPLWPLIIRNAPCAGAGPWDNFRAQALALLKDAGERWPQ